MEKRYADLALTYAVIAMVFGVFYREFTKFNGFTGQTSLSFMHTHYFMLGMVFFFILMFAEKLYAFSDSKMPRLVITYQFGLNITGIGHILIGISMVLILLKIRKQTV